MEPRPRQRQFKSVSAANAASFLGGNHDKRHTWKRTWIATAAAGFIALGVSAAQAEIKIGATVSETGPAAFLGDPEAKTLKMLVEKLNAAGGINGEKIELVALRRRRRPEQGAHLRHPPRRGRRGRRDHRRHHDRHHDVDHPGRRGRRDPVHLAGRRHRDHRARCKEWVFKTPHTDRMACQKIFEDMKARGITKIGMISGTDGFGASMRKQCLAVVGDYGIEILADETYGPTDADMTPQLTNIKSTDRRPGGAEPRLRPGPVDRDAQLSSSSAIGLPLYQSHGVASKGFIELAGAEAAEGVRLPGTALLVADLLADDDPQKPVVTAYKAEYREDRRRRSRPSAATPTTPSRS